MTIISHWYQIEKLRQLLAEDEDYQVCDLSLPVDPGALVADHRMLTSLKDVNVVGVFPDDANVFKVGNWLARARNDPVSECVDAAWPFFQDVNRWKVQSHLQDRR